MVRVPYQMEQKESNLSLTWNSILMTVPDKFTLKDPVFQSVSPTSAAVGNEITITGLYFNGPETKVFFGEVEATLKFVNKTSIICSVPADLPSGSVTVRIQTGEGVLYDEFTFTVL